ncbi:MAG: cytochrome b N-terminal domain-containing protein [Cyanobacteria bacterium]|nr:cytochrome b N-terminal domain-containing protein [Cyanobacteriota bacterium]
MYTQLIGSLQKNVVLPLEKVANKVFTQSYNPFYYHGALPNFFIWVLFISGLLLFAYYTPTLERAYNTLSYITHELPFGNAIRSMHRYASDGMMIFVMLHMLRVWFTDRYREYRILPWLTGVILLSITFTIGLSGYMMIWDQEAVTLTYITANFLKQFPVIGPSLSSLLLGGELVSDFTLTRLLFLHLGIPLLLMFFLWMHYLRITRPVTDPPLALNLVLLGGLFLFCGVFPVSLGDRPNLQLVSPTLDLSFLYAWPQYLITQGWSTGVVWLLVLGVPVGLLILPYIQKKALRGQFAQVLDSSCTGCSLCYHDCPYEAITMVDRNDPTSRFKRLAIVDPGRCANCGLCVGACAFKAIEIPRRDSQDVLKEIEMALNS